MATDKISVLHQAHFDLVKANKDVLGIADVWYGDQNQIPRTPSICVEASTTAFSLDRVGGKGSNQNTFNIYHLIYLGKMQDVQLNLKQAEELAERLRDLLHTDMTFGGLIVYGRVTAIEPGSIRKPDVLMKVQRVAWEGMSQTRIV